MTSKSTNTTNQVVPFVKENTNVLNKEGQNIQIEPLIRIVRDQQVLLDSDLAMLYGVETKRLKEQVRRNIERFPEDFMFQLTKEEVDLSRSQIATLNIGSYSSKSQNATMNKRGHNVKYLPYAFTENGIAMLSSVLRSPVAIETNIRIMRAFTAMRKVVATTIQVMQRLTKIEYQQIETDKRLDEVFRIIEKTDDKPTQGLFYNGEIYDSYTFVCGLVKHAKSRIILFDNYIDETVLTLLDKRTAGVTAKIYTKSISRQLQLDITRHNAQYPPIDVTIFTDTHDRFLCIDDEVYHFGASIKDMGHKWFAFNLMEQTTDMLLNKI